MANKAATKRLVFISRSTFTPTGGSEWENWPLP
jgi:hypothetical protein